VSTYPERRGTEDETKEECVAAKVAHMIEGKPLVLLQVNCRSVYNKALDFWNLIHTYNPDVVLGTEKKLAMLKFLGLITQLSEGTRTLAVAECLFM
jgi:hypothetical protein